MNRRVSILGIVLALVLACAGCSSWHTRHASDPKIAGESVVGRWRVTLKDGQRIELAELSVRADTLHGFYPENAGRFDVAMDRVAKIEQRATSVTGTSILVLGILAMAAYAALWVIYAGKAD